MPHSVFATFRASNAGETSTAGRRSARTDVGAEFKGVSRRRKASRSSVETEGWAERNERRDTSVLKQRTAITARTNDERGRVGTSVNTNAPMRLASASKNRGDGGSPSAD